MIGFLLIIIIHLAATIIILIIRDLTKSQAISNSEIQYICKED